MKKKGVSSKSTNYYESFLGIDLSCNSESMKTLSIMIETSLETGFDVQVSKTILPGHVIHVGYVIVVMG